MFWELIAMLFSGAAMAGVVMLLRIITGGRLPRWMTPAAAALAMIAFSIQAEYSWYPRNVNGMPPGFEVIDSFETSAWYRPWTLAQPYTNSFIAVDTDNILTNPALPDAKLATLYVFTRNALPVPRAAVFDCAGNRRADNFDGSTLPGEGDWVPVDADDPFLTTVCEV